MFVFVCKDVSKICMYDKKIRLGTFKCYVPFVPICKDVTKMSSDLDKSGILQNASESYDLRGFRALLK